MRQGLLRVVPQAVLDLLTWQELEKKICGDPDITIEALRRTSKFDWISNITLMARSHHSSFLWLHK